jgi:Uma2 family endonuclease
LSIVSNVPRCALLEALAKPRGHQRIRVPKSAARAFFSLKTKHSSQVAKSDLRFTLKATMVAARVVAPATYQDLKQVPDTFIAQIIDGELHTMPRPASAHAHASSTLGMDLGSPFQRGRGGPGGWWILDEPEIHLNAHVLVSDLAGYRKKKLPSLPNVPFFTHVPDWICEVISPSTARIDRTQKRRIYAESGVSHYWTLDPAAQTLEVFRLQGTTWLLLATYGEKDVVRAEPFDAVELELGALWLPTDAG